MTTETEDCGHCGGKVPAYCDGSGVVACEKCGNEDTQHLCENCMDDDYDN